MKEARIVGIRINDYVSILMNKYKDVEYVDYAGRHRDNYSIYDQTSDVFQ